jgi:predicted ester cyclase
MGDASSAALSRLTPQGALEVFGGIEALHRSRDRSCVATVFSDDAVLDDDGAAGRMRGHAEIGLFLSSVWRAFPDFEVRLLEGPFLSGDGQTFSVRGRILGTMRGPLDPPGFAPTGARVDTEFGGFYELGGGLVRRARIVIDTTDLAIQLGLMPRRGGPSERVLVRLQRLRARLPLWRAAAPGS